MKQSVRAAARDLGLDVDVRTLDQSTRTVPEAARAVGCREAEIAKSLVFVADGEPVVVVTSGAHRVDTDVLADVLDVAEVRQASADEVRAATGFPVGGVPPFAHSLPVLFDETLLEHETIYAAGGDGNTLFAVAPARLVECTRARVARVASVAG
jgi:prolyl-tRNA editing enzyme YbaK/EbsC (Cys-tRNA(Pro) deacylase)